MVGNEFAGGGETLLEDCSREREHWNVRMGLCILYIVPVLHPPPGGVFLNP